MYVCIYVLLTTTSFPQDERVRLKKYGARILSMDQIEGIEPEHENWGDLNLGFPS